MTRIPLPLLLACARPTPSDTATCPVQDHPTTCPLDQCAADCPPAEEAIACCAAAHGNGDFDAANLARLQEGCAAADCDPEQYLSPAAALCIAQAQGLAAGLGWCGATFDFEDGNPSWTVRSQTLNNCREGLDFADVGYDAIQLDARSGALKARGDQIGLAECPG